MPRPGVIVQTSMDDVVAERRLKACSAGAGTEPLRGNMHIAGDTFGEVSEFDGAAELVGN